MCVIILCTDFQNWFIKLLDFPHSVCSKTNTRVHELDRFSPSGTRLLETRIVLSPKLRAV